MTAYLGMGRSRDWGQAGPAQHSSQKVEAVTGRLLSPWKDLLKCIFSLLPRHILDSVHWELGRGYLLILVNFQGKFIDHSLCYSSPSYLPLDSHPYTLHLFHIKDSSSSFLPQKKRTPPSKQETTSIRHCFLFAWWKGGQGFQILYGEKVKYLHIWELGERKRSPLPGVGYPSKQSLNVHVKTKWIFIPS